MSSKWYSLHLIYKNECFLVCPVCVPIPVSYTHLDVYKRQVHIWSHVNDEIVVMDVYALYQVLFLKSNSLRAVSYTHLDVYKRQVLYTVKHFAQLAKPMCVKWCKFFNTFFLQTTRSFYWNNFNFVQVIDYMKRI